MFPDRGRVPVVKARPPKLYADGIAAEERGIRAFRPAFYRGVRALRDHLDDLPAESVASLAALTTELPWDELRAQIVAGWQPEARRMIRRASADALRVARPGLQKDISRPTPEDTLDRRFADRFAAAWAAENAGALAEMTAATSLEGIRLVVSRGLAENRTIDQIIRDMRTVVGNNSRDVKAILRRRTALERQGLKPEEVDRNVQRYSDQLLRRRAQNIARTETNMARSKTTLDSWRVLRSEGMLKPTTRRRWVEVGGCEICKAISAGGPVGLDEPYQSKLGPVMHPPAHGSCRCSEALVFD